MQGLASARGRIFSFRHCLTSGYRRNLAAMRLISYGAVYFRLALLAALSTAALATAAEAATRAYVMNGLFVGTGLARIADQLRARGDIVFYGSFEQNRDFAADACAHPQDRIVVIGHSFGAERAAEVATQAAACGARDVTLIGVDPSQPVQVSGVAHAVNFVGEMGGTIAGAKNIPVPGYTHMGIMESPAMQALILSEVDAPSSQ
jgi:hypothetical protein